MLSDICEELVIGSPERPLDPLYVQPASLELATIRKKQGEELVCIFMKNFQSNLIVNNNSMSRLDFSVKIIAVRLYYFFPSLLQRGHPYTVDSRKFKHHRSGIFGLTLLWFEAKRHEM